LIEGLREIRFRHETEGWIKRRDAGKNISFFLDRIEGIINFVVPKRRSKRGLLRKQSERNGIMVIPAGELRGDDYEKFFEKMK